MGQRTLNLEGHQYCMNGSKVRAILRTTFICNQFFLLQAKPFKFETSGQKVDLKLLAYL